jgi:hypothetical protein
VVEDCPETVGELLKLVQRRISLSPHGVGSLEGFPGEARDEGGHPLMAMEPGGWWPGIGPVEEGSSQPFRRIPGAGRDETHWDQEEEGRSEKTPVVLVEALEELPVSPSGT